MSSGWILVKKIHKSAQAGLLKKKTSILFDESTST